MEFSDYINKLLLFYDCVIIPGFGGIVSNYTPATVNELKNIIHPPDKKLLFNRNLSYNDGLLASYISVCEEISYNEAFERVSEMVSVMKSELENGKRIRFGNIGEFSMSNNGQVGFTPDPASSFLVDSYGLSPVRLPQTVRYSHTQSFDHTIKYHSAMNNSHTNRIVKTILIGIPVIALLIIIPIKAGFFKSDELNYSSLNPINVVESVAQRPADSIVANDLEKKISVTTNKKSALLYQENAPGQKIYYLVAGSFKAQHNAEKFKTDMISKGYEVYILRENDSLYRVALFRSENRDECLAQLSKLRNDLGNQAIWMLNR